MSDELDDVDKRFDGFIRVDRSTFYSEVWPLIRDRVEAIESNWKTFRQRGEPLLIGWGDPKTKEVIAATWGCRGDERNYVRKDMLRKLVPKVRGI